MGFNSDSKSAPPLDGEHLQSRTKQSTEQPLLNSLSDPIVSVAAGVLI